MITFDEKYKWHKILFRRKDLSAEKAGLIANILPQPKSFRLKPRKMEGLTSSVPYFLKIILNHFDPFSPLLGLTTASSAR